MCDRCCEKLVINNESIEKRVSRINYFLKDLIKPIKDNQEYDTTRNLIPILLENERRQWDKQMEFLKYTFDRDKLHIHDWQTIDQRKEKMIKWLGNIPEKHESHEQDKIKYPLGRTIKKCKDESICKIESIW